MEAATTKARSERRQSIRQALGLCSLLLFPVVLNYMSPYLVIDAASYGIINGSFITFGLLFLSSLFLGRGWCGWVCPGAGLQDASTRVNSNRVPGGRWNLAKWVIWLPWVGAIAFAASTAGGYHRVDVLYLMDSPISVDRPAGYLMYYTVICLFLVLALTVGRRAGCHYICWMAPFMILGRRLGNALSLPGFRLKADSEACSSCRTCTRGCPMSLDVSGMVRLERMENSECVLCGTCVDNCPRHAISYTFGRP